MIWAAIGAFLGLLTIWGVNRLGIGRWNYPIGLICLPFIYVGFALIAARPDLVWHEIAWGGVFIIFGFIALARTNKVILIILGLLWLLHAGFDLLHHNLIENPGVPVWYPGLCAGFDVVIGSFILWLASRPSNAESKLRSR